MRRSPLLCAQKILSFISRLPHSLPINGFVLVSLPIVLFSLSTAALLSGIVPLASASDAGVRQESINLPAWATRETSSPKLNAEVIRKLSSRGEPGRDDSQADSAAVGSTEAEPTPPPTAAAQPSPTATPEATQTPSGEQTKAAPKDAPKDVPASTDNAPKKPRGIVAIDPGHGGTVDPGAERKFPDGYLMREQNLTLKVALKLAPKLEAEGFRVVLTRNTSRAANQPARDRTGDGVINLSDDLQARVDIANEAKADLFVSIHFNAAANAQGGTEVFYCQDRPFADKSKKMAQFLQQSLLDEIGSLGYRPSNRGVKVDTQSVYHTHLYVLGPATSGKGKPIAMPSVLGEALFITNPAEGQLLRDDKTIDTIAEAYNKAVVEYFLWLGNR